MRKGITIGTIKIIIRFGGYGSMAKKEDIFTINLHTIGTKGCKEGHSGNTKSIDDVGGIPIMVYILYQVGI